MRPPYMVIVFIFMQGSHSSHSYVLIFYSGSISFYRAIIYYSYWENWSFRHIDSVRVRVLVTSIFRCCIFVEGFLCLVAVSTDFYRFRLAYRAFALRVVIPPHLYVIFNYIYIYISIYVFLWSFLRSIF